MMTLGRRRVKPGGVPFWTVPVKRLWDGISPNPNGAVWNASMTCSRFYQTAPLSGGKW
jgi:hypothetical protein